VAAAPDQYELDHEDATHLETNPYRSRVWQRRGKQASVPAVGTNRRLSCFGSVETQGRGRVEVLWAGVTSTCFLVYLPALDQRHAETGKEVFLVLDNGPCHPSKDSQEELAARKDWLHAIWLARYSPELSKKEREWRYLKRDARGHLARDLRSVAAAILAGRRGGGRLDIVDRVPDWFLAGHRKPPTGRKPGRPKGAKDSYKRSYHRKNLPAPT
jgi:transposase